MEPGDASHEVVKKLAEREGIDPVDLHPPLYEYIDPEALDQLARNRAGSSASRGTPVVVTFPYEGYLVTVDGDGGVRITDREPGGATDGHRVNRTSAD